MIDSKYLVLAFIFLVFQIGLFGQTTANNNGSNPIEASIALGTLSVDNFKTYDLEYDDIKGSPYVEKKYLKGHVVLIDNKKTQEVSLQYDIYTNEFFFINAEKKESVIDLKLVREIVMKGEDEDYLFKRVNPRRPHQFYEILYEDESMDIYNEMEINFFEGKEQGITRIDPRFSRDDNYFVLTNGNDPKSVKLKKKNIYKLFSKEDQKLMDKIAKDNKIKLKKSKDFKKLFAAMKN